MGKFKVGDVVVRTGKNYAKVKTGEKYIVREIGIYSNNIIYLENAGILAYDARFFEKVNIKSFQNLKII